MRTISEHIRNILTEGELSTESVIRKFRMTAGDGRTDETAHYGLEMILAVGYLVRSHRETQFRQWATAHLAEFLSKGFTIDDERLKNPGRVSVRAKRELATPSSAQPPTIERSTVHVVFGSFAFASARWSAALSS